MKGLAAPAALALLIAPAFVAAPIAAQKVLPSTEVNFARLLLGCWSDGWHAQFSDGTEGEGKSVVCFHDDGKVTFTYGDHHHDRDVSTKGQGLYELRNDKLILKQADMSVEWPFLQAELDCDAVIEPGKTLKLTGCTGDDSNSASADFAFARNVNEVLLDCWSNQASADPSGQLVSYTQFCFEADDTLRVMTKTPAGEFASAGTFEFHGFGERMFLNRETGREEGWLFGADNYVSCLVSVTAYTLDLTDCVSGADFLETTFTGLRT